MNSLRGYSYIMLATVFWGFSATVAKFLFTHNVDTLIIVQTRSTLAFLVLAFILLLTNRSAFRIQIKDLSKFILVGVIGIAYTNFSYYYTVKVSTVATAILIQYIAPVFIMIYMVMKKEEHFTVEKCVALIFSLGGCFLAVSGGHWSAIQLHGWGIVTGITSAFSFTIMIIAGKHVMKQYSLWTMLVYGFGIAALFWLFINPPAKIFSQGYTSGDWWIFFFFAMGSILIPYSLFNAGLHIIEASRASIIGTLEPVVAILSAYFIIGEGLSTAQIVGACCVIAAIIVLEIWREEKAEL